MPTYEITFTIPLPITVEVDADDGDGIMQAITNDVIREAIDRAVAVDHNKLVDYVDSAAWDSSAIVDKSQAQRDDQAVDDMRDGDGCHDDSEVSS